MKKVTFLLTGLTGAVFCAENVFADPYNYRPYVGTDYVYGDVSAKGFSPQYSSANVRIGSEYGEFLSTELFASQSASRKNRPQGIKLKSSLRSYGLDLLAYLPLGCEKRFSLVATTGIGEYVAKEKLYPLKHHNEHGYGYRFGGGIKYAWNQNWHSRILARYVNFDHLHGFDHAVEYSAGVEFHF